MPWAVAVPQKQVISTLARGKYQGFNSLYRRWLKRRCKTRPGGWYHGNEARRKAESARPLHKR